MAGRRRRRHRIRHQCQQSCHRPPFGRDTHEVRLLMAGRRPRGDTFDILPVEPDINSLINANGCRAAVSLLLTKEAFCKKSGLRSSQNRLGIDLAADGTTVGSRPRSSSAWTFLAAAISDEGEGQDDESGPKKFPGQPLRRGGMVGMPRQLPPTGGYHTICPKSYAKRKIERFHRLSQTNVCA